MITAALTWPDAVVHVAWIAAAGLVVAVLIWSIFRTGQTAIRHESVRRELADSLRTEIGELRRQVERSESATQVAAPAGEHAA